MFFGTERIEKNVTRFMLLIVWKHFVEYSFIFRRTKRMSASISYLVSVSLVFWSVFSLVFIYIFFCFLYFCFCSVVSVMQQCSVHSFKYSSMSMNIKSDCRYNHHENKIKRAHDEKKAKSNELCTFLGKNFIFSNKLLLDVGGCCCRAGDSIFWYYVRFRRYLQFSFFDQIIFAYVARYKRQYMVNNFQARNSLFG